MQRIALDRVARERCRHTPSHYKPAVLAFSPRRCHPVSLDPSRRPCAGSFKRVVHPPARSETSANISALRISLMARFISLLPYTFVCPHSLLFGNQMTPSQASVMSVCSITLHYQCAVHKRHHSASCSCPCVIHAGHVPVLVSSLLCCEMPAAAARDCATRVAWRMRVPASIRSACLPSFNTVTVTAGTITTGSECRRAKKLLAAATGSTVARRAGRQRAVLATLGLVPPSAHFTDFSRDGVAESHLDSGCGQHMYPYTLRFTQAVIFALDLRKHDFSRVAPHGAITWYIGTP